MPPADMRAGLCWGEFLRANGQSMIACDFFTVEPFWLGRLYVLFFIELASRRVHLAGAGAAQDFRQTLTDGQGKRLSQRVVKKLYPTRGEGNDAK